MLGANALGELDLSEPTLVRTIPATVYAQGTHTVDFPAEALDHFEARVDLTEESWSATLSLTVNIERFDNGQWVHFCGMTTDGTAKDTLLQLRWNVPIKGALRAVMTNNESFQTSLRLEGKTS